MKIEEVEIERVDVTLTGPVELDPLRGPVRDARVTVELRLAGSSLIPSGVAAAVERRLARLADPEKGTSAAP